MSEYQKTFKQVKEFIDSKNGMVSKRDLLKFYYGEKTQTSYIKKNHKVLQAGLSYQYENYDLKELKKYLYKKICSGNIRKDRPELIAILKKDTRFRKLGRRAGLRMLDKLYNKKVSPACYVRLKLLVYG
jgi:hypothetical protein